MSRKNGKKKEAGPAGDRAGRTEKPDDRNDAPSAGAGSDASSISAGGWHQQKRYLRWREFPIPGQIAEPFRVACSRDAYADLVAHAKESLGAEVCGVLAGEFCEDQHGEYVSVEAAVRGTSVDHGAAHVTYTQETWNRIHECMERRYPKFQIVGWYHSHPGFGVEFSDMDLFIQENFFAGRGQVALITDPLGGDEALCVNTRSGIEHVSRFWVDGRERKCRLAERVSFSPGADGAVPGERVAKSLRAVEDRLGQALQALEDLRTTYYRFLLAIGMIVAVGIIFLIGNSIYSYYTDTMTPPKLKSYDRRIPVLLNGRTYWFGINVVGWEHPKALQAAIMEAAKRQLLEEAEQARKLKEEQEKKKQEGGGNTGEGGPAGDNKAFSPAAVKPVAGRVPSAGAAREGDKS